MTELLERVEAAVGDEGALQALDAEVRSDGDALSAEERDEVLDRIARYLSIHSSERELELAVLDAETIPVKRRPAWAFKTITRRVGRKVEESHVWDPGDHPRGRLGRFVEIIGELAKGDALKVGHTPVVVKRSSLTGTLSVHSGSVPAIFDSDDAAGAAARALDVADGGPEDLDDLTDQQMVDHLASMQAQGLDRHGRRVEAVVPPERLHNIFDGFEHGNLEIQMLRGSGWDQVHESGAVMVNGVILEKGTDRQVGEIQRSVSLTSEGELEIGHATLSIDHSFQGTGFAAALQLHAFPEYAKLGVKRVRVSAANVGGYAWARAGFSFDPLYYREHDDPPELAGFRGAAAVARERLDRVEIEVSPRDQYGITQEEWDAFVEKFPTEDEIDEAARTGDMRTLEGKFQSEWEIAAYGRNQSWEQDKRTMWLGKLLLLKSHWTGALRLDEVLQEAGLQEATSDDAMVARVYHEWLAGETKDPRSFPLSDGPDANLYGEEDEVLWEQIEQALGLFEAAWNPRLHPRGRTGLFVQTLDWMRSTGLDAYLVGGAVRDKLLGKEPKDADFLAAGAGVAEIKEAIGDTAKVEDLTVGEQLVGVRAKPDGIPEAVEIAPPRREVSTGPGRHDFEIVPDPNASVEEDLARRDFTVNAIAENIQTGEVVDPYGGAEDVKDRVLRTITPDSFRDDPLRIMRGLVRVSVDGLEPEPGTREQMVEHAAALRNISGERIQGELNKLLMGDDPAKALRLARDTGVLAHMIPELSAAVGFKQESKYHDMTVDEHTFAALEAAAKGGAPLEVRLALLVHDAGKPASAWKGKDDRLHYYANEALGKRAHEEVGTELARSMLKRLRYPRGTSNTVEALVAHHMFQDHAKPRPVKARKFLAEHGLERARMLIAHKRADMQGKDEEKTDLTHLNEFGKLIEAEKEQPLKVGDLEVSGKDLLEIGYPPGPALGVVLKDLLTEVIGQPQLNNRDWLLRMARKRLTHVVR